MYSLHRFQLSSILNNFLWNITTRIRYPSQFNDVHNRNFFSDLDYGKWQGMKKVNPKDELLMVQKVYIGWWWGDISRNTLRGYRRYHHSRANSSRENYGNFQSVVVCSPNEPKWTSFLILVRLLYELQLFHVQTDLLPTQFLVKMFKNKFVVSII